jgi:hypothetical protein
MHFAPSAAADDLVVSDGKGGIIWTIKALAATGAGGDEYFPGHPDALPYQDFVLTTIDGGTLYVDIG